MTTREGLARWATASVVFLQDGDILSLDPNGGRAVGEFHVSRTVGRVPADVSRRTMLKHVAAVGVGAALSARPLLVRALPVDSAAPGRIDVHHHMLPPFYMELRRSLREPGQMPAWSPEKSLEDMEKSGVSRAMLSLAVSGVAFDPGEAGRSLARKSNDYGAQLVMDHPAKLGLLAALPMLDTQGSLAEIEYALDKLHANGVALLSSYGDKWLGDPAFTPIFEELNRRKAVAFVHPTAAPCCANLLPHVPASTTEFLFDTTRTIDSLLVNGTFSRFLNLRFIFSHGGGTMPILAHRIVRTFPKDLASQVPNGVMYELKRQFYDTASATDPTALTALMSVVPSSQILFGSDFPFISAQEAATDLAHSGLPGSTVEAINNGNAVQLFQGLKS